MMHTFMVTFALLIAWQQSATADTSTDAESFYEQGQAAFDAKRFDEAVSAWERSYELSKEPALLFNIGQAYRQHEKPGNCSKALSAYKKFIELDPRSEQRSVAESFLTDVQMCASREASATPTATASEIPATSTNAVARFSDEAHPGRTKKVAGLAIVGGGVALVATGLYFGHRASSLGDEVTRACANGCNWAVYGPKHADGQSAQTKQYVFDGLGIAAIIGGGVLYWRGSREQTASTLAIAPRRGGAAITWSRSW